jgi:uncharacterized protein YqeY
MPNKKPVKKTTQRMTKAAVKKKAVSADKATRSLYDGIINAGTREGKRLPARVSTANSRQLTSKEAKKAAAQDLNKFGKMLDKPKNKNLNYATVNAAKNVGIVKGWSMNPNSKGGGANTKFRKSPLNTKYKKSGSKG